MTELESLLIEQLSVLSASHEKQSNALQLQLNVQQKQIEAFSKRLDETTTRLEILTNDYQNMATSLTDSMSTQERLIRLLKPQNGK